MSSILDTIKSTLSTLAADPDYPMSGGVYYGICNAQSLPEWNYFVFNRRRITSNNAKAYTDVFEVHIVHEDYIMEGYELDVVRAIKDSVPGCSLMEDVSYEYTTKADTQIIVELCNLTFKRARKADV